MQITGCPNCGVKQFVVERNWCASCGLSGPLKKEEVDDLINQAIKQSAAAKQRAYRDRKRLKEGKEVRRCPTCQRMV